MFIDAKKETSEKAGTALVEVVKEVGSRIDLNSIVITVGLPDGQVITCHRGPLSHLITISKSAVETLEEIMNNEKAALRTKNLSEQISKSLSETLLPPKPVEPVN